MPVTGERQLLQVDVIYDKPSNMRLALDWQGPDGVCLPSGSTTCAQASDCDASETCDIPRQSCRDPNAAVCFAASHCASGASCDMAVVQKNRIVEPQTGASLHRIKTQLPAFIAGDYVLKQLASLLRSRIRREDVLARFGGEEFALILPEIDLKPAVTVAEKLRTW